LPGSSDVAQFSLAHRLKDEPLGRGFFGIRAYGRIDGAPGEVALFPQAAIVGLSVGVVVEHLVFLAGTASRPCNLALHFGCITGQKCQAIQIAPNEQTIEVFLLCFLEHLPGVLEPIDGRCSRRRGCRSR
jgi:hypothetical protein